MEIIGAVLPVILVVVFCYFGIKIQYKIEQNYRKKHGLNIETFKRWADRKTIGYN